MPTMLGVFITLLVALGCVGIGFLVFRRWLLDLDAALRFGVAGLFGIGVLGTLTLIIGLIPGGFSFGLYGVGLFSIIGIVSLAREGMANGFRIPRDARVFALLTLVVVALFGLVCVLAPSDADDWDTLAYHLAVPKLWLAAGHVYSVPSLHHSNFPDVIDDLYVWGLTWGGQAGAKAFSLAVFLLGICAVFGFARQKYGENAAWWSAVGFATVPTIMWESGTAYIDVGHGLYAGLGLAFAAWAVQEAFDRRFFVLSATMFGFAAASKYTGIEALFISAFLIFVAGFQSKQAVVGFRSAVLVGLVGVAIASPWYLKNVVNVGNPVYPFLYERLGGKDWDQRRADIYRREQQSFGVGLRDGKRDPKAIGHAALGLAYQPGRYVNPGQTEGLGTPDGAVGIAVLSGLVFWTLVGRRRQFESLILASVGLYVVLWFFLSQQSRYMTTLAPPAAILLGGAIVAVPGGMLVAAVTVLQAGYSVWLFQSSRFSDQIQVVTGKVSTDEYLGRRIAFYSASKQINDLLKSGGKVALYDEVFGYLLDVPYMWGNPGHSTIIPYDSMSTADDYTVGMKKLGFTHVYISLSPIVKSPEFAQRWLGAMGVNGSPVPFSDAERKSLLEDWENKWEVLLSDAVAAGKLRPMQTYRSGVLFSFE